MAKPTTPTTIDYTTFEPPEHEDDERMRRLGASIREMACTPGSAVAMCHEQGKTAVYLSKDRKHIVAHSPHGPIKRTRIGDIDRTGW